MTFKTLTHALCCVGLLFISSCAHRSARQIPVKAPEINEARLNDIPLPLGVRRLAFHPSESPTACTVTYVSKTVSVDDLIVFYYQEMERYGWRLQGRYSMPGELLLIFDKPTRLCAVSFRVANKQATLIIMTGTKEGGSS